MKKCVKCFLSGFLILVAIILGIYLLEKFYSIPNEKMTWGVSFSPEYARYLGLNVKETYRVILDDWHFKNLRLTARWDLLEPEKDKFDFNELDYLMNEAAQRNAKVVLAMGQKTPRWPECNVPSWAENLKDSEYLVALNNYLVTVAKRYQNHGALEIYQVENEPFLKFGKVCREIDSARLESEISAVKKIDSTHPILVTDSGELSLWNKTAKVGDLFGTTVYRIVWNSKLGYVGYDWLPAFYYRLRAAWQGRELNSAWVAELQAEPWVADHTLTVNNVSEQFQSMSLERLKQHLLFAQKTGFGRAYLWGAEWWYWLKVHGYGDIADFVATLNK
jgi:hypothetical protein